MIVGALALLRVLTDAFLKRLLSACIHPVAYIQSARKGKRFAQNLTENAWQANDHNAQVAVESALLLNNR